MAASSNSDAFVKLLNACKRGHRPSQKALYKRFYGYGMTICMAYAHSEEEAEEILNDGFLKVFQRLETFREEDKFKSWLRRILINASIDHYRRYQKHYHQIDIAHIQDPSKKPVVLDDLSAAEVMRLVQALPPAYRIAFTLFVIEGYTHVQIAKKLGISEGTSKSNLAKARMRLRKMLKRWDGNQFEHYG